MPAYKRARKLFMKRLLVLLLGLLCGVFAPAVLWAQVQVPVVSAGHNTGAVASMQKGGLTYVDAQQTARKVGAGVSLFAASRQMKITAKGFYAILTADQADYIVNAKRDALPGPMVVEKSTFFIPVNFFLTPAFQQALGKEISFSGGSLYVERPFDFERMENVVNARENKVVFSSRKPLTWQTATPNGHTVVVSFPGFTVKRDEHFRFKTDYIASVDIRQQPQGAQLRVVLGKKAKNWTFEERSGRFVFRAAQTAAPAESAEEVAAAVTAEETASSQAEEEQPAAINDDDFEEMPAAEQEEDPVLKEDTAAVVAVAEQSGSSRPEPVIKPEPNPLTISPAGKLRIVVDPGHGGKDAGAVRGKYREKDWNLSVGKELARLLKKGGYDVKITRDNDTFVALGDRAKISNNFKADLFVSIHTNATKNRHANGFQVYFRSEKATDKEAAETAALENEAMQYEEVHYNFVDALLQSLVKNEYINESSKLAGYVRNAVYKQPGIGIAVNQNSSVRQANFYVLKGVNSPAILVEMGFISSQKDRARLSNKSAREKMALGIYNGIVNYSKKELKK